MFLLYVQLFLFAISGAHSNDATASSSEPVELPEGSAAKETTHPGKRDVNAPGKGAFVIYSAPDDKFDLNAAIPVRNSAGKKVGKLSYGRATEQPQYLQPIGVSLVSGENIGLGKSELVYFDYEFRTLKYYGKKDGLLQILKPQAPQGLWVNPKDFGRKHTAYNWVELAAKVPWGQWSGFDAYRVRAEPKLDGKVLVQLRQQELWPNKSHAVRPTGEVNGHWAQVKVQTFEGPHSFIALAQDLEEKSIGEPITGWMKIGNDDGLVTDIIQNIF